MPLTKSTSLSASASPTAATFVSVFLVFISFVSVSVSTKSQLIVEPGGVYKRVTVRVEDQNQPPEDCSAFLTNLEVRENNKNRQRAFALQQ